MCELNVNVLIIREDDKGETTEMELEVCFGLTPSEPATLEYPGCDCGVELEEVVYNGVDILLAGELSEEELEQIHLACFERAEDPYDYL